MHPQIELVDDGRRLASALTMLGDGPVGIDVERADSLRYHRRAALIQIGVADRAVLVDPLAVNDLSTLQAFLDGRLAILHALENDLVPLAADGIRPPRIADTGVAAAFLGLPTGLAPLLVEVLGVDLDGDKEAYQRADWARRPLEEGMLAYAAGDVMHLPALWLALENQLDEAGRRSWYAEELDALIEDTHDSARSWEDVRGLGRLDGAARAVLKALWEERESIASAGDIAPNRILHDRLLIELAADPPGTPDQLIRRSDRRRSVLKRNSGQLFAAIQRGQQAAPEAGNGTSRRWSDADRAAHERMRRARAEIAKEVGIEPGVLCPGRVLWLAIGADPTDPASLCGAAGLRRWQAALLADALWTAYRDGREPAAVDAV